MKRGSHRAAGFEGRVGTDGTIVIPPSVLEALDLRPRGAVSVRLVTVDARALLNEREVPDEEIERISSLQLESTDQVVKFLLSEGSLKSRRRRLKLA
ncbi:MAG: hypothetical protein OEV30_08655 [Ignavibacteria bacterium]|nr:hypothetical protein [Ignavibacteria bacterium]